MKIVLVCWLLLVCVLSLRAQADSIIFNNNDCMVGELKDMDRGKATVETDYSDVDFKIEWRGVQKIFTQSHFLITLSDGRRLNGRLHSEAPKKVKIFLDNGQTLEVGIQEVVYLKSVKQDFFSRIDAAVDVGFSITKSQNLQQLTVNSKLGYLADSWSGDASFNVIRSTQDSSQTNQRTNGELTFRYFLPNDWFCLTQLTFLSNTEQKLNLRSNGKLGLGKYFVHTNKTYWAYQGGASFVKENFADSTSSKHLSMEAFLGTEFNVYDAGDLSMLTRLVAYRSLTEHKRWRSDVSFETKYKLPLDFYIKVSFLLNYDNQPAEGASEIDYGLQTSFGWKF